MRRLALLALVLACGSGPSTHDGVGTVTGVEPDLRQLMLDHEEIAGVMPAMKMNFDVADAGLLEGVATGDRVRFGLEVDGSRYRIVSLEKIGESAAGAAAPGASSPLDAVAAELDEAPGFALIDQNGGAVSLEALRGSVVLLDFIYTRCPGPCPILTSARVQLQQKLPDGLRPGVRFVSISLDPEHDTPEALRSYALARGADFASWSFLTGTPETVDDVLTRYGVGKIRKSDGEIEHVVVTFLIDARGRIAKRYFGLEHGTDEFLRDLKRAQAG